MAWTLQFGLLCTRLSSTLQKSSSPGPSLSKEQLPPPVSPSPCTHTCRRTRERRGDTGELSCTERERSQASLSTDHVRARHWSQGSHRHLETQGPSSQSSSPQSHEVGTVPHPLYKRNWRRRSRTRSRASVLKPVLFRWHCCHTSAPRPCPAPGRPHREQKERPSCRPASSQWSQEGCRPPTELCLHISDAVSLGNTSLRVPGAVPSPKAPHEWTAHRTDASWVRFQARQQHPPRWHRGSRNSCRPLGRFLTTSQE